MAAFNSDQMTNLNASPVALGKPYEFGAPVRRSWFTYTVPAGGVAASDTVALTKIPSGAIIFGGKVITDGLVTAGVMDIGDGTTANKYADGIAVASAGAVVFADTILQNVGDILTAEITLTATNPAGGATWTAAKLIKGYVDWGLI